MHYTAPIKIQYVQLARIYFTGREFFVSWVGYS